jgi:hypothetical protein
MYLTSEVVHILLPAVVLRGLWIERAIAATARLILRSGAPPRPCSLVRRGARPEVGAGAWRATLQRVPGCSHHMCAKFAAVPPHARRAGGLTRLYIVRDHKVRPDGAQGRTPKVRA